MIPGRGAANDRSVLHFSSVRIEAQDVPTDTEPERRSRGSHSGRSSRTLQMFLLGLEHGMTVGDIQTGWQGPASACLRHTRRDSSRKGLTNTRKGQRGRWGAWSGEGGPREGQRPRSKGSPGLCYCTVLWPPARKYSIATGLHSPEASPSQTPELDGQTDLFPARLPSSIFENKWTKGTEQKLPNKKKKTKRPPQSRTEVRRRKEWKEQPRSPWKSPPKLRRGWEVEPQYGVGWG